MSKDSYCQDAFLVACLDVEVFVAAETTRRSFSNNGYLAVCGKAGHVIFACTNRGRPQSYAAAANSSQVSAQNTQSHLSVAEDPSVYPSPSNNEVTTNQASTS